VREYPTPSSLMITYDDEADPKKQEKLLSLLPTQPEPDTLTSTASTTAQHEEEDTTKGKKKIRKPPTTTAGGASKRRSDATKKEPKVGLATSKKVYHFYNTFH
jgi:ABC-type Fe3+ transport system substrate-binding protein